MKKTVFTSDKEFLFENEEKNRMESANFSKIELINKDDKKSQFENENESLNDQGWQNILMYSMNVLG